MEEKKLPTSVETEKLILGAILIEKDAIENVVDILKPEMFYDTANKSIYEACLKLYNGNKPIDIYTVSEQLAKDNKLEEVGGSYYVATLTENVGSASHIEYHSKIVVEKYIRRKLIKESYEIGQDAYNAAVPLEEIVERQTKMIDTLGQHFANESAETIETIFPKVLKEIEQASQQKSGISGISSGFTQIDSLTHGFQHTDMIVVGARPSMGKTAFALSLMIRMAMKGVRCLLFSLEMSKVAITKRITSMISNITGDKILSGRLSVDDWNALEGAAPTIMGLPIIIDDEGGISTLQLKTKCRQYMKKYGFDIIMLDYLQLMKDTETKSDKKNDEVSEISRKIKNIAKELNVPFIVLSQLNRNLESRPDKTPINADLRDSGSIEQDADVIMMLYRPEVYGIELMPNGLITDKLAQVIITKQRNGSLGTIDLQFDKENTRWTEME